MDRVSDVKIAYFDCFSGAAGDMIVAALVDAGVSADALRGMIGRLPIEGYTVTVERTTKQGFASTRFDVALDEAHPQPHRHLSDVRKIIDASDVSASVRARATAVFERLARAEAEVHGTRVEEVHFHEVGAVDAIIDIVGACWGLERLGVESVVCSPIPVGSGTVTCAHGVMPVPAPATALLLKGVPIAATDEVGELTTPTGAALLAAWSDGFGAMPAMTIERIGMGAGRREGKRRPNVLRVMVGTAAEGVERDRITVLEASIDDVTPEVLGYTLERLLNAGALDAYCLPIQMKKSRPGALLTVLAEVHAAAALESIIFAETTTLGIRHHEVGRSTLARRVATVETRFGPIRVKIGSVGGREVTVAGEYEDCREAAIRNEVALRVVMSEAVEAFRRGSDG